MLIFGHKLIKSDEFFLTQKEAKFKDGVNCLNYDESEILRALSEGVKFAIFAKNEDEILLSNALKAEFIIVSDKNLAKKAAKMAEFYLFDSKILLIVNNLKNLYKAYKIGVDGVILKEFLK